MTVKHYSTRKAFLEGLNEATDGGIDVNKSLFLSLFSFVTTKGDSFICRNAPSFVQQFNKEFGGLVDLNNTRLAGSRQRFMINFFKEIAVSTPVAPEQIPVVVTEEVVATATPPVEQSETLTLDIEYAKSLLVEDDKKASKEALIAYAKQHDIKLSKNKSFDNMILDLESNSK